MINIKNETAGLDLKNPKVEYGIFKITIGNKTYSYQSAEYTTEELYRKFTAMQKYSDGKALAWLKKHSTLVGAYEEKNEGMYEYRPTCEYCEKELTDAEIKEFGVSNNVGTCFDCYYDDPNLADI